MNGLIKALEAGETSAIGMLHDYLEERGDERAKLCVGDDPRAVYDRFKVLVIELEPISSSGQIKVSVKDKLTDTVLMHNIVPTSYGPVHLNLGSLTFGSLFLHSMVMVVRADIIEPKKY